MHPTTVRFTRDSSTVPAIVLPPKAVRRAAAGPAVLRRDPASGAGEEVPVTLGEATPADVEIRNGVRVGDMVVAAPP